MFVGEKVGKEWTMDQAPQYAIDHVANSKKNIFEFEFLNSLSEKISSFFGLTSDSLFYIDLGITKHVFLLFFVSTIVVATIFIFVQFVFHNLWCFFGEQLKKKFQNTYYEIWLMRFLSLLMLSSLILLFYK